MWCGGAGRRQPVGSWRLAVTLTNFVELASLACGRFGVVSLSIKLRLMRSDLIFFFFTLVFGGVPRLVKEFLPLP